LALLCLIWVSKQQEKISLIWQLEPKKKVLTLWTITRILWPLNPQTPYAATPDGSLPAEYQNTLDPLDVLTYVASITNKIALGTSVIDMFFYTPIMLAKRFATLDLLSQGRAICGLGIGWSKDEYQASNIPFKERGASR
jgi:alkanesulfonate monooxygenase SsuD/methylene tetrahydromethanopterin reductase-like flavin-dependent oxidoreductase (luciferase family)